MVPDPGTVVWLAGGRAVVFVGDAPGLVDVAALAPQLRQVRRVDVVGDMWEAARPFKQALREAWNTAARTAREASRTQAAPKTARARCGRPRADGQACRQWAGWGSDTPGVGPCRQHGGSTAKRRAEGARLAEQARTFVRLAGKARVAPLTTREQLQAAVAGVDVHAAAKGRRGLSVYGVTRSSPGFMGLRVVRGGRRPEAESQ